MSLYRSALKWFHKKQGLELPAEVMKQLGCYTSGFMLVKNQHKQDGEEEAEEGRLRQPLQFAGYLWFAKQAMGSGLNLNRPMVSA